MKGAVIPGWSTGCRSFTTGSTRCSTTCRVRRSCLSRSPRTPPASGLGQIKDYYDARQHALTQRGSGPPYKPLPPDRLYLGEAEWRERLGSVATALLTPFAVPEGQGPVIDAGTKQGRNFAAERAEAGRQRVRSGDQARHGAAGRRQARHHRAVERRRARAHEPCARRPCARQSDAGRVVAGNAGPAQAAGRARSARARKRLRDRSKPPSSASRTFWATAWCARGVARTGRKTSSPR